jgi:hypothetical protein
VDEKSADNDEGKWKERGQWKQWVKAVSAKRENSAKRNRKQWEQEPKAVNAKNGAVQAVSPQRKEGIVSKGCQIREQLKHEPNISARRGSSVNSKWKQEPNAVSAKRGRESAVDKGLQRVCARSADKEEGKRLQTRTAKRDGGGSRNRKQRVHRE